MCQNCWTCENLFSLKSEERKQAEESNQKCICKSKCPFVNE